MKWIVGLDLRHQVDGPVHFARWLTRATRTHHASALHVIKREFLAYALGLQGSEDGALPADDRVDQLVQAQIEKVITRTDPDRQLGAPEVVVHSSVVDRLAEGARTDPPSGLILGRQAKAGEDAMIRLGSVARKLLRVLPGPVVIVPPDLKPSWIGGGPVVATTNARPESVAACRFAHALARELGRELVLAHVADEPDPWLEEFDPPRYDRVADQLLARGEQAMADWTAQHGLGGSTIAMRQGEVARQIQALAAALDAPLIVCGSRKLNTIQRLFVTSATSEIAAGSRRPVLVVPPDYSLTR